MVRNDQDAEESYLEVIVEDHCIQFTPEEIPWKSCWEEKSEEEVKKKRRKERGEFRYFIDRNGVSSPDKVVLKTQSQAALQSTTYKLYDIRAILKKGTKEYSFIELEEGVDKINSVGVRREKCFYRTVMIVSSRAFLLGEFATTTFYLFVNAC